MATTSLWPIHNTGGRGVRSVVKKLVEYAENDEKTSDQKAESGKRTNSDTVRSVLGYVSKDQKVESKDNKVSVIVDLKADKMSEDNYNLYNMGESYESLKDKYSKDGYTCK